MKKRTGEEEEECGLFLVIFREKNGPNNLGLSRLALRLN